MGQSDQMTDEYKAKLSQGLHYQDKVVESLYDVGIPIVCYSSKEFQHLKGENKAGIEIKNDTRFRETGNFFIEIAEKSRKENTQWIPSGIYRNDNTWLYLQGDELEYFIFGKRQLVLLHRCKKFEEKIIPTSKGFLLPVKWAVDRGYVLLNVKMLK